jgi:hypothetical protein
MKLTNCAALAISALLLGACTQKPEASIEKDCIRLGMMKEVAGAEADKQKKACSCFATKLKGDMSEANLKGLAKALKQSKMESEFEAKAKENGLDDGDSMVLMGAAKACAVAS